VSYAELAGLVNRVGHVLRDLGVRQEERVLLALSDGVEFVATWFAAQKIGAVTAEVYTFLPAKDLAYYMDYTRAGVVVVDANHRWAGQSLELEVEVMGIRGPAVTPEAEEGAGGHTPDSGRAPREARRLAEGRGQ
jgi:acyl-coenzyme A synthetase/AMP-(fatty) acid ligase